MQRWGAGIVSRFFSEQLHTNVHIERLRIGIFNRVVIDGISLYDQKDSLMLNVVRMAAKVDPLALFERKIRIDNAQLFGTRLALYKDSAQATANYQFVLDALKSQDTTSNPIDLNIGRLLVRHANVRYDQLDKPETPGQFNPYHLHIKGLGFNTSIRHLTPDSVNAELRRLNFSEQSGFALNNLNLKLIANSTQANLSELDITLPHSKFTLPSLSARYPALPQKENMREWLQELQADGCLSANINPQDFAMFLPEFKHWQSTLLLNTELKSRAGTFFLNNFSLKDIEKNFLLELESKLNPSSPDNEGIQVQADILTLRCNAHFQQFVTRNLQGEAREINPLLTRLEQLNATGNIRYNSKVLEARLKLNTALGAADLEGTLAKGNELHARIHTGHFQLGRLLGKKAEHSLQSLSMSLETKGKIKGEDKLPDLMFKGTLEELILKGYPYRNIAVSGLCKGKDYRLQADLDDVNAQLSLQSALHIDKPFKRLSLLLEANHLNPYALNLSQKLKGEHIDLRCDVDLNGTNLDGLRGQLDVHHVRLLSDSLGTLQPGPLHIAINTEEGIKAINIESTPLNAHIKGHFKWRNLNTVFQQIASDYIPTVWSYPKDDLADNLSIDIEIQDTSLVRRLTAIPLYVPEKAVIKGRMNGALNILHADVKIPNLTYGNENLRDVSLLIQNSPEMLQSSVRLKRLMKGQPVEWVLNAYMGYDKIRTVLNWDNGSKTKQQKGEVSATGIFFTGRDGKMALHTKFASSQIMIGDTIWTMHPSTVEYHDGVLDIKDFGLSLSDRYLNINGRLSKEPQDSLAVQLNKINLEYIFQLINFNAVEFAGNATGYIYAKHVLDKPVADAYLNVSNFTFNNGRMGNMDIHGNWGNHDNSIYLNAHISDPPARHHTTVQGTITPGRGAKGGLDLRINTQRINLYFLNKFTKKIFDNLQGRATGWARVFGPFKQINIEGDLVADEVEMGINMLGTRYRVYGDSIVLRPNHIRIPHATAYDRLGTPGQAGHSAIVEGNLLHENMKNLRYSFNILANNILGYDFQDFGDSNFYGTVYASGDVKLNGGPGVLQADINATPLSGTQFVYNVTSPETLTQAGFITYVSGKDSTAQTLSPTAAQHKEQAKEEEEENDIYLNFDLDITPEADMRLLMDPKSGDNITLNGNGRIRAHYHNKGKFRMYGIYNVDHGVYKLSLQDFIRKDFIFQKDGSVTFGGDAYQAALNLKAVYTVPNVSLDDLSATSLGLSNTRVDCVMNITGKPSAPMVSFDFDLPNANEDEKQMVRSMVNTEEEKNMQAIYLLGIGRFYNSNAQYMQGTSQSSTAMNSLISSTLSSQFNQMMSNMVGSSNWSFGANLRTGETGWEEIDVEGMLSGRFLNNRLLFNGNFGYRESVYSNNNFIGDFDVQYLLTPTGTVSLKAYNETNDRYFIQSSLTTQGIGIQLKKDFNRWHNLFHRSRKHRKKSAK